MQLLGRRLPAPTWRAGALAAAAAGVFALAFLLGRASAPGAPAKPTLATVAAPRSRLSLAQLSQAAPLPALAAPAKPVVRVRTVSTPATTTPAPRKHRSSGPVTIVGSG